MNAIQILAARRRRCAARLAVAAAAMVAASGLTIPAASADPGGLVFDGCIGDLAGCTATWPAGALDHALAVTVDGRQVYAAAGAGAVTHFTTDSAGNLIFAGCIGSLTGCTAVSPPYAIAEPTALVAVNGQLYVADHGSNTVSHFVIDSAGNLIFDGCIGGQPACTAVSPANALYDLRSLAVTPGGRQLYAGSLYGISHFTIDQAGNLAFAGCIGDLPGCTPTNPARALASTAGLAASADGAHLYAAASPGSGTSGGASDVTHLTIDAAGNLTFAGCIGDLPGCTPIYPAEALDYATAVAFTPNPNGAHLYESGLFGISHFRIGAAGSLIFAGCIGPLAGCTPTSPADALASTRSLAVRTPGTPHLYAISDLYGGAVTHLTIDAAGNLIFDGCIGAIKGCTSIGPANALAGGRGIAINSTGENLYTAGYSGNAVSHFLISLF